MKKMLDEGGGSFEQDALSRLGSYMPDDVIDVVDRGLDRGASYHDNATRRVRTTSDPARAAS